MLGEGGLKNWGGGGGEFFIRVSGGGEVRIGFAVGERAIIGYFS